jgi:CRP-like cAMP-binding protein
MIVRENPEIVQSILKTMARRLQFTTARTNLSASAENHPGVAEGG